jgi:hypothetical protein
MLVVLVVLASILLSSCHSYVDVKQAGIALRFNPEEFGKSSITQQPRLTAEENGTDVPVDVGPAHTVITFGDKRNYISFVPLNDKSVGDYAKSYPQVYAAARELRKTLKERPAAFKPDSQLPDLSSIDEEQEMHCKVRYFDLPLLEGIAFLAQYTQEEHGDPVNNQQLRFVFQGLTKDGRYYIDSRFGVANPSLPKGVDDTTNIVRDEGNQYLRKAEKDLDALPDESFKPPLGSLKELFGSISIAP